MKKYFLIAVVGLLLLTGCGKNQVVCSVSLEEGGISMKTSMIGELDSANKITKVSAEYEFNDATTAEQYCSLVKLSFSDATCSGKKITIPDASEMFEDDEQKIIGLTKEEFITLATAEAEGVTCK